MDRYCFFPYAITCDTTRIKEKEFNFMSYLNRGRLSLSDEVYNQILIKISEGTWKEGEKIPSESKLCEMFQVSRVSVRSAIQKLQGQGLITTMQGIGSFVNIVKRTTQVNTVSNTDISSHAFLEFFEFRQAIEFKAIELFVVRATEKEEQYLCELVQNMKQNSQNKKEFTKYDFDFHISILRGAKNFYLYQAMKPYEEIFYHYLEEISRLSEKEGIELAKEHETLCDLLLKKKPTAAKEMLLQDNAFYHVTIFKKQTKA